MNVQTKLVFLLAVIGSVGIIGITSATTQSTRADDTCVFSDTNQECNLKIKKLNVDDDFNIKIINGQGSGSGGGTVDAQARADITVLQNKDVEQDNALTTATQNQSDTDSAQDAKIAQLEAIVQNLTGNVVSDITIENGTAVVIPPPEEPPVNDTGSGSNETDTGGNSGFPPTDEE